MTPELLTISQFCAIANCGKTNTYKLINAGKLKAVKLGKKTLIPKDAMENFIANLTQYPTK